MASKISTRKRSAGLVRGRNVARVRSDILRNTLIYQGTMIQDGAQIENLKYDINADYGTMLLKQKNHWSIVIAVFTKHVVNNDGVTGNNQGYVASSLKPDVRMTGAGLSSYVNKEINKEINGLSDDTSCISYGYVAIPSNDIDTDNMIMELVDRLILFKPWDQDAMVLANLSRLLQ